MESLKTWIVVKEGKSINDGVDARVTLERAMLAYNAIVGNALNAGDDDTGFENAIPTPELPAGGPPQTVPQPSTPDARPPQAVPQPSTPDTRPPTVDKGSPGTIFLNNMMTRANTLFDAGKTQEFQDLFDKVCTLSAARNKGTHPSPVQYGSAAQSSPTSGALGATPKGAPPRHYDFVTALQSDGRLSDE